MFASDMSSKPDSTNASAWPSVETEMPPTVPPAPSCMCAMAGLPCAATWGRSLACVKIPEVGVHRFDVSLEKRRIDD